MFHINTWLTQCTIFCSMSGYIKYAECEIKTFAIRRGQRNFDTALKFDACNVSLCQFSFVSIVELTCTAILYLLSSTDI
jgi:hypothetical protein